MVYLFLVEAYKKNRRVEVDPQTPLNITFAKRNIKILQNQGNKNAANVIVPTSIIMKKEIYLVERGISLYKKAGGIIELIRIHF